MAREWRYRGKTLDELKTLSLQSFAQLVDARARRTLLRTAPDQHKTLLKNIAEGQQAVHTHCRDVIVLPQLVGKTIHVHNGKEFMPVLIDADMLGHRLGEFALTRRKVSHSAPGIGATRSSASLSVR
ncbi:MAG: 30S ribosomal protein S19 [Candidatus Woesearchaeota archaeon]|nr:30S ribosomal protein S19 [Candidatus Woesearchaeota archaeon]